MTEQRNMWRIMDESREMMKNSPACSVCMHKKFMHLPSGEVGGAQGECAVVDCECKKYAEDVLSTLWDNKDDEVWNDADDVGTGAHK